MNVNASQHRYIEGMGDVMVRWGLPRTTGRIYAYLLLRPAPATLDDIVRDLGVAKSGASVATRQLMGMGLARSYGEPGSRRLRYDALYDLEAIIAARTAQTLALFERLREGATVATAPSVRRKLNGMTSALESAFADIPQIARHAQARHAQARHAQARRRA